MSDLTVRAYRTARKMFGAHKTLDEIASALGNRYTAKQINAALRGKRFYVSHAWRGSLVKTEYRPEPPPPEVLARQAERIMLRPASITALICGDPLPGESALDRFTGRGVKSLERAKSLLSA